MRKTTGVSLEQDLVAVGQRNLARAAEAIQKMGPKYACHPINVIRRDPVRSRFMPATELHVLSSPVPLLRRGEK